MNRKKVQHIVLESDSPKIAKKKSFETAETIAIQSSYSKKDTEPLEHLDFAAGTPPFLRGPYSTMYVHSRFFGHQRSLTKKVSCSQRVDIYTSPIGSWKYVALAR